MRHGKGLSIALLLLSMTGSALASGDSAPVAGEAEAVCLAAGASQPSEVAAGTVPLPYTCPSFCRAERFTCLSGCNADAACQQACNDAYYDCCGI